MAIDPDIAALYLEPIAFKVCVDEGWEVEDVDRVEGEYRAFLHLIRHSTGKRLVPSKEVDTFWHYHILDTQKYIEDCNYLFGRYVHHYPYAGIFGHEDAQQQKQRFRATQELLSKLAAQDLHAKRQA